MKKIRITASQKVTYSNEVEVSDEDYELLKSADVDVMENTNPQLYYLIESLFNANDIFDSENEFTSVDIEDVKPIKSLKKQKRL